MKNNKEHSYLLTDRSVDQYLDILGSDFLKDIQGTNILEIGPGFTEKFAHYLAKKGANVYTLSPSYRSDSTSGHYKVAEEQSRFFLKNYLNRPQIKRIAGFAEEPSFVGIKFKKIIALFSVPWYLDEKSGERMFKLCVDMLEQGGEALFIPMDLYEYQKCAAALQKFRTNPSLEVIDRPANINVLGMKSPNMNHLIVRKKI